MTQLMHSFRGHSAPPDVLAAVEQGEVAAFCLFAYNVVSPRQVLDLSLSIRRAAEAGGQHPPLIGIDQEGGQLIAITGGTTELPGNMALGATRSPKLAEQAGYVLGRELLAMGVNLNFAPSVDVNVNPNNPVIGTRSFGDDPDVVAELAIAMMKGMQGQGVIATAKHFPGHGDTAMDSHHDAPVVAHSRERIENVELAPFRAVVDAGIGAIMTSHIRYPVFDEDNAATLSKVILTTLLRQSMGFKGLIITDAMDMHAVARLGKRESVEKALWAGNDLVLLGHHTQQIELTHDLKGLFSAEATRRIQQVRERLSSELPSFDVIGCDEHQAIAQEIADKSITMVRNGGLIPLESSQYQRIAVVTIKPKDLTPADTSSGVKLELAEAVKKRHPDVMVLEVPYNASNEAIRDVIQATSSANVIIVGTISADQDAGQAELIKALHERGKELIVIAMRTPYDIVSFPMVDHYLCSYGIRPVTCEAIARVIFGEIAATGVLPCKIPGVTA